MSNEVNSGKHLFRRGTLLFFILLIVLTLFSSSLPDGLEWVASRLGLVEQERHLFSAPLADYVVSSRFSTALNQFLSAVIGAGIIILFLWVVARFTKRTHKNGTVR